MEEMSHLIKPPLVRTASALLDRSLFATTFPIAAARVASNRDLSRFRARLRDTREILVLDRFANVRADPDPVRAAGGMKCILLHGGVRPGDPESWSSFLKEAVKAEQLGVIPFELKLDYDYWTYADIMESLLPEDAQGEIPAGFAIVGHVAHLNLRDEYLPYKKTIAQVIMDKNETIRTVINKTDDVGTHSEFRTFGYEVLAGEDDMNVELREGDCVFRFDYSKVYWNSRLQTEHKRLVDSFSPGEVVCDVMAGIGPFAVPAGKKGVFFWANDLNPASYESLKDAITRNKVNNFVRPFCSDGHTFIHQAADDLLALNATGENTIEIPTKSSRTATTAKPPPKTITLPPTISHFVMNLPATAISFLPSFSGIYHSREALFHPHTDRRLPMVHVHCFSTKSEDNVAEHIDICQRISKELAFEIRPGDEELRIHEVRDVAPKKRMFCASFRLPAEVSFRERGAQK